MCAIFQLDINIPAVPPGFCDGGNERRIKQILIKKRQIFVGRTCNFARLPQVWAKTRHDDAHSHLRYTRSQRGRGGEGDLHEFLRGGLHEFLYGLVLWYQGKATGAVKSVQILGH